MPADKIPETPRMYPALTITKITNPNRFYAIPLLGGLVKFIMLIPVYIYLFACTVATLIILFINSFSVFFKGKYLPLAYELTMNVIKLNTKVAFFYSGLTNTYPGFSFDIHDNFSITMPAPKNPNKWFATPLLGGLIRLILLIPFNIFTSIVKNGVTIALFISWIPVLFTGTYPDTTFELDRDYVRLNMAQWAYFSGLSDTYPSFWISLNHKQRKILLLIAGLLLFFTNSIRTTSKPQQQRMVSPKTVNPRPVNPHIPNQY